MGLLRRKRKRGSSKEETTTRRQSVEKRLQHQRKEKAGASQKAEAARRAAKDVYSLIGFDALYSDGIAQVEPGLFSQTSTFNDISYQSASDEEQKSVCRRMRKLYDGLTPDVGLQMLLVNRPLSSSEIGNRRFFESVEGLPPPMRRSTTGSSTTRCWRACRTSCASAM